MTRLEELLRHRYLASILFARRNSIDLTSLWKSPSILILHTDEPTIGAIGTRLLIGCILRTLFRTALRVTGTTKVVLALDEMPRAERLVGDMLVDTIAIARGAGLQLICASQYIFQLSEPLRRALNQAAVSIRFRCGADDAAMSAPALASDCLPRVSSLTITEKHARRNERPHLAERSHTLLNQAGQPLRASTEVWPSIERDWWLSNDPVSMVCQFAKACGVGELYVRHPRHNKLTPVRIYAAGVRRTELILRGPSPLRLVILFPRPVITKVSVKSTAEAQVKWLRILCNLQPGQCVLKIPGVPAQIVAVTYVDERSFGPEDQKYLQAAQRATCPAIRRSRHDEFGGVAPMSTETMCHNLNTRRPMMTRALTDSTQTQQKRRSRYQPVGTPLVVTPMRKAILVSVSDFGVISTPQLSDVTGLPLRTTQRQARHLFDARALRVVAAPRALLVDFGTEVGPDIAFGSSVNIYQPTIIGQKWLFQHGLCGSLHVPQPYGPSNWRFVGHSLRIADLRVFSPPAVRANDSLRIERWRQERPARCTILAPFGRKVRVNPDVHLVLRLSDDKVLSSFAELDMGSEGRQRWTEKLSVYRDLLLSPSLPEATGGYRRSRLLIVTATVRRRDQLSELVEKQTPEISPMVWLADKSILVGTLIDTPAWVRPGSSSLSPLLTSDQLQPKSSKEIKL